MGGPREGSDFQNLHRNKRGITLNLKSPEGVAVLKKLAAKADVLVENFRPDVKQRLGIDYEALRAVNPRLIYASISGFGQDGPYANRPGFDQIAQGMGGLMSITGLPGQGPVRVGIPIADLSAGLFCALGIMVALLERETVRRGPVGRDLAAAGADLHARLPGRALADRAARCRGRPATTIRPRSRPACSRPATATSTSRPPGRRSGSALRGARRAASWPTHPDYATGAARSKNRDALNADDRDAHREAHQRRLGRALNKAGVPCGPIYSIDQVFADPQVKHLGIAQDVRTQEQKTIHLSASR